MSMKLKSALKSSEAKRPFETKKQQLKRLLAAFGISKPPIVGDDG